MQSRSKTRRLLAVAAMVGLLGAACSSGRDNNESTAQGKTDNGSSAKNLTADNFPDTSGKTIGYVPIGMGTPLTEQWLYQINKGAERWGWKVVTRDPNWNAQAQPPAVQTLIDQGVDALVVHNTDVNLNAAVLKQAEEAGIWTVTVNMASTYLPSVHVGGEWGKGGELQAQEVVDLCGGKGKVAIITGDASSQATLDLLKGGQKVFDANPGMQVVANQAGNWDRTQAHDIAATLLKQHPDLCAIWGFWDQMTYGAALAVQEAGLKGKVHVVTMDSTVGCQALKEGVIDTTFSFHVPRQGDEIVNAIAMLLQMGEQGVKPGQFKSAVWSEWTELTAKNVDQVEAADPTNCYDGKS
jgi:ribose transport system substrate-binding protein